MTNATEETFMKILADTHKCIGAGTCVTIAPDFFDQNDADGIVVVLQEEVGSERRDAVVEAAEFCPAQALILAESD